MKYAEYAVPLPMIGSLEALNAPHSSTMITASPMAPIGTGLRELNDLPTLTLRVVTGPLSAGTAALSLFPAITGTSLPWSAAAGCCMVALPGRVTAPLIVQR